MFDSGQAGRLFREFWDSPLDLAKELYSMFTSREPATVIRPVTIEAPPGQPGLKIVRASTPLPVPTPIRPGRPGQAPSSRPDTPASRRADVSRYTALARRAAAQGRAPAGRPDHAGPQDDRSPGGPVQGAYAGAAAGFAGRPPATPQFPAHSQPYQAPLFSVDGPVSFGGDTPVQFEVPPLYWSAAKGEYVPFDFEPKLTRIKARNEASGTLLGKVVGEGSGTARWSVTLYPDGPDTAEDSQETVDIQILGLADGEEAPADTWISGIGTGSDDQGDTTYYYAPSLWIS